jgi:hypothetical protein
MSRRSCAGIALLGLAVGLIACAQALAASPAVGPWTSLRLQAEKLAGLITAEVGIEPEPAGSFPQGPWPAVTGEPLRPSGPNVLRLSIRVTIEPLGITPLRMENRLWFDPASGAPLRLIRTRLGTDDYAQWFVFGREEVFRLQREPASPAQAAAPPDTWTRVSQNAYAFQTERCPFSAETSMLICLLSEAVARGALDLAPRCVFHKRQLHFLTFQAERREHVAYDYLERSERGSERKTGATDAVTIRIGSTPVGSYRGSVEPWFRDAYLTFSADGRLPLVVACDLPVVGHVELRLGEIRF